MLEAFYGELSKLGYAPGRNIHITQRLARPNTEDGTRYAAELAAMDLELIVAQALPYALLIRAANPAMPMVIGTGAGLVCNGFGKNMEWPGGNATGMEELPPGLTGKRLELLVYRRSARPALGPSVDHSCHLRPRDSAGGCGGGGGAAGNWVKAYRASNREQIAQALETMVRDGQQGLVNFQGGLSLGNRQLIVDFAAEHRLPAIYQAVLFAEAGGLMTWAPDQTSKCASLLR